MTEGAGDVDAAVVVFDDAAGEREAEAGAIAFCCVERTEDVGQVLGRDAASVVFYVDHSIRPLALHSNFNFPF